MILNAASSWLALVMIAVVLVQHAFAAFHVRRLLRDPATCWPYINRHHHHEVEGGYRTELANIVLLVCAIVAILLR